MDKIESVRPLSLRFGREDLKNDLDMLAHNMVELYDEMELRQCEVRETEKELNQLKEKLKQVEQERDNLSKSLEMRAGRQFIEAVQKAMYSSSIQTQMEIIYLDTESLHEEIIKCT